MPKNIPVVERILSANDRLAQENRLTIDAAGVFSLNMMASPGAGKTSLIEQTVHALKGSISNRNGKRRHRHQPGRRPGGESRGAGGADQHRGRLPSGCVHAAGCTDQAGPALHRPADRGERGQPGLPCEFRPGDRTRICWWRRSPRATTSPTSTPACTGAYEAVVINKIDLLPYVDFRMDYFKGGSKRSTRAWCSSRSRARPARGWKHGWVGSKNSWKNSGD